MSQIITFSSSDECARKVGMTVLNENTRPTREMVDEFRRDAYNILRPLIGTTDTPYKDGLSAERFLVAIEIRNVQNATNIPMQLPQDMLDSLLAAFEAWGLGTYEPNKNEYNVDA